MPLAAINQAINNTLLVNEILFGVVDFHIITSGSQTVRWLAKVPDSSTWDSVAGQMYEQFGRTNFKLFVGINRSASHLPSAGKIEYLLTYDADEYCVEQVRQIGHLHFKIMEAMVANAGQQHDSWSLWSAAERQQVLEEFNGTARPIPEATLPALFERQAARTPEAVAVMFGDESLTYGELNARANRLARYLIGLGVRPETLVGIGLERSVEMVVALLGTIKAGGAYLPLDPEYPPERLAFMIQDTRTPLLLTQQGLLNRFRGHATRNVDLDGERDAIAQLSPENLLAEIGPDNLAYVVYTSGSTGRPKGIAVPQRAVIRLVFNTDYVNLGPGDRIAQAANTSFDAATFEIWGALLNGGAVVILPRETILSPAAFAVAIKRQRIDSLFLTTASSTRSRERLPILSVACVTCCLVESLSRPRGSGKCSSTGLVACFTSTAPRRLQPSAPGNGSKTLKKERGLCRLAARSPTRLVMYSTTG